MVVDGRLGHARLVAAMRRTATVESVAYSTVGRDLGDPTQGCTHVYCAAVADLAALERYLYDPVHLEGDHTILPRLARLHAVRFSDDPDPELTDKITAVALGKIAAYPDWGQLLEAIPDVHL
jgi:hypothetical protein